MPGHAASRPCRTEISEPEPFPLDDLADLHWDLALNSGHR